MALNGFLSVVAYVRLFIPWFSHWTGWRFLRRVSYFSCNLGNGCKTWPSLVPFRLKTLRTWSPTMSLYSCFRHWSRLSVWWKSEYILRTAASTARTRHFACSPRLEPVACFLYSCPKMRSRNYSAPLADICFLWPISFIKRYLLTYMKNVLGLEQWSSDWLHIWVTLTYQEKKKASLQTLALPMQKVSVACKDYPVRGLGSYCKDHMLRIRNVLPHPLCVWLTLVTIAHQMTISNAKVKREDARSW